MLRKLFNPDAPPLARALYLLAAILIVVGVVIVIANGGLAGPLVVIAALVVFGAGTLVERGEP